jgi:hypothetical protein
MVFVVGATHKKPSFPLENGDEKYISCPTRTLRTAMASASCAATRRKRGRMGDFDLAPPALPGEKQERRRGLFSKLFTKDEPATAPLGDVPLPMPAPSDTAVPNLDEIRRKLGFDDEPDILPARPTSAAKAPTQTATPVPEAPVGSVNVDDWTQDDSTIDATAPSAAPNAVEPMAAPAKDPWDTELNLSDMPEAATTKKSATPDTYPEPPTPRPEAEAEPVLPAEAPGVPEHHDLIQKHLAELDRQHERITKKIKKIAEERPTLPEWKLQAQEVTPDQYFFLRNGQPIKSLSELADALEFIDDITFEHHVNEYRNDFANWIRDVIKDEKLAARIQATDNRAAMLRELLSVKEEKVKDSVKEQRELQKTITKRKEAVKTLLGAEKEIGALQKRLDGKTKELLGERKRSESLVKDHLDKEVERRLGTERAALIKARAEAAKAKTTHQVKTKTLDTRDQQIAEREKKLLLDSSLLRKDIEELAGMKKDVEPMLREGQRIKEQAEAASKSEENAKQLFAETKALNDDATRKEEAMSAREQKIADDLTKLAEAKAEFVGLKAESEKRESAMQEMEADANAIMADAKARLDAALTAERASREQIAAEMKRLAALKDKIDKTLSKVTNEKQKVAKGVILRKQYEEALSETKHGVARERADLEREGYSSFIKERVETTPPGQATEQRPDDLFRIQNASLYAKVESCRQALERGDLETAKRLYSELRDDYARAQMGPTDKETLYNDIREIYDDIHLVMLAK